MFTPGTIVRRRKSFRSMVVLEVDGTRIICGWVICGRFCKREFSAEELKVRLSWSDLWPLT